MKFRYILNQSENDNTILFQSFLAKNKSVSAYRQIIFASKPYLIFVMPRNGITIFRNADAMELLMYNDISIISVIFSVSKGGFAAVLRLTVKKTFCTFYSKERN